MSQKKRRKKKGNVWPSGEEKKNKGNLKDVHMGIFVN